MTAIRLDNICVRILKHIDLVVASGELFVLLGSSGAGKSTLLQVIAGLLPHEGRIFFDRDRIDRTPSQKRSVGYLFQDLLLFPHCSLYKNIILAMLPRDLARRKKHQHAQDLLRRFGISHLSDRYPFEISGGEKQRAALARALATEPRILLLDEPFSSLDEPTAQILRTELKQYQLQTATTTIFVTHNWKEALQLADRIGILENGRLETTGTPAEIAAKQKIIDISQKMATLPSDHPFSAMKKK